MKNMDVGSGKVFYNAQCPGPEMLGTWKFRVDELQTKVQPFPWSCWQPSSGGVRYGQTDFVTKPIDYLGVNSLAHPTGDFNHVSMAFDLAGYPAFATNLGETGVNLSYYSDPSTIQNLKWEGTSPVLFNNFIIEPNSAITDVITYYIKTGLDDRNLYARFSNENYANEHSLMEFPLKLGELTRAEVESGRYEVLYGITDRNRGIKIYFSRYPEFPFTDVTAESTTGFYGFHSGDYVKKIIDSGSQNIAFESGQYYSPLEINNGFEETSGHQNITFESGLYLAIVQFESGVEETSGHQDITFESGQYYSPLEINSELEETSGHQNITFESGQYFAV